jgi:hypothetical protein
MDPENDTIDNAEPAAPAPAARTYTEDEVQERVNRAAAAARRDAEAKLKAQAQPAKPRPPAAPPADDHAPTIDVSRIERDTEFRVELRMTAKERGWSPEVVAKVSTLYKAESPESPADWLAQTATLFGGAVSSPAKPAAPTPHVPNTPAVPAPISQSAPSTAVPLERDVDVLSMDASSVHELMRKKGASDPSRPYDPRNRAGRREVRRQFEEAMHKSRIVLDGGR